MADVVVLFDFDKTIIDCDSDNWVVDELGFTDMFNELLPTMPWNSLMVSSCFVFLFLVIVSRIMFFRTCLCSTSSFSFFFFRGFTECEYCRTPHFPKQFLFPLGKI